MHNSREAVEKVEHSAKSRFDERIKLIKLLF